MLTEVVVSYWCKYILLCILYIHCTHPTELLMKICLSFPQFNSNRPLQSLSGAHPFNSPAVLLYVLQLSYSNV